MKEEIFMNEHISNAVIILMGLAASVIGHLFDVPPATLWVAAIGSSLGVAFSRETSLCKAFLLILIGTVATGWAVPIVLSYAPDLAQKSIAAILSFSFVAFRNQIKTEAPNFVISVFTRIHNTIKGTKP